MKKYLMMLLLVATPIMAAQPVVLEPFESISVMCNAGENPECPTPEVDIAYAHGGDHKRMTEENQDCRTCHGADLRGTSKSVAEFARTCIAPDDFQMPDNAMSNERWITTWPDGEEINIVGTETARVEVGDIVGCQMCHDEVEFHNVNGREIEMKVRGDD